jgi:hypothetical protein
MQPTAQAVGGKNKIGKKPQRGRQNQATDDAPRVSNCSKFAATFTPKPSNPHSRGSGVASGDVARISAKHLAAYLDEMTWRFNNRKNPFLFRDTMLKLIHSDNLEYKELTKAA